MDYGFAVEFRNVTFQFKLKCLEILDADFQFDLPGGKVRAKKIPLVIGYSLEISIFLNSWPS